MLAFIRRTLLSLLQPFTVAVGRIHLPVKRKTDQFDIKNVLGVAQHGDIVLSRKRWMASNLLIRGKWKHVGVIIELEGKLFVIEAVPPLVRLVPLDWWVEQNDYVKVLTPQFLNTDQKVSYPFKALQLIGRGYDYLFETNSKQLYCAELVTWSIQQVFTEECPWKHRVILGVNTTLPQDFANSSKFLSVYSNF